MSPVYDSKLRPQRRPGYPSSRLSATTLFSNSDADVDNQNIDWRSRLPESDGSVSPEDFSQRRMGINPERVVEHSGEFIFITQLLSYTHSVNLKVNIVREESKYSCLLIFPVIPWNWQMNWIMEQTPERRNPHTHGLDYINKPSSYCF